MCNLLLHPTLTASGWKLCITLLRKERWCHATRISARSREVFLRCSSLHDANWCSKLVSHHHMNDSEWLKQNMVSNQCFSFALILSHNHIGNHHSSRSRDRRHLPLVRWRKNAMNTWRRDKRIEDMYKTKKHIESNWIPIQWSFNFPHTFEKPFEFFQKPPSICSVSTLPLANEQMTLLSKPWKHVCQKWLGWFDFCLLPVTETWN